MRNQVSKLMKDLPCVEALECLVHLNDWTRVGLNELLNSLISGRGDVVLCILMCNIIMVELCIAVCMVCSNLWYVAMYDVMPMVQ